MNRCGFSLLELIIVVAIIGIALSVAVPEYTVMRRERNVERQAREMLSEISSFRLSAIQNKQRRAIILNPFSMQFKSYNNDTDDLYTGGTLIRTIPLNFEIRLVTALGAPLVDQAIAFDNRGNTQNNLTIVVLPVDINGGNGCVIVTDVRTNIGRMTDATTCTAL